MHRIHSIDYKPYTKMYKIQCIEYNAFIRMDRKIMQ